MRSVKTFIRSAGAAIATSGALLSLLAAGGSDCGTWQIGQVFRAVLFAIASILIGCFLMEIGRERR